MKTVTQWIEEHARDLALADLLSSHEEEFTERWEHYFTRTVDALRKAGEESIEKLFAFVDNPKVIVSSDDFDLLWGGNEKEKAV